MCRPLTHLAKTLNIHSKSANIFLLCLRIAMTLKSVSTKKKKKNKFHFALKALTQYLKKRGNENSFIESSRQLRANDRNKYFLN